MPQHPTPDPSGTETDFGTVDVSWCAIDGVEALARQTVEPGAGLSSAEVAARRKAFGANRLAEAHKPTFIGGK